MGQILTPQQAADRLGVHRYTLLRMAREGRLPRLLIGKTVRFDEADLIAAAKVAGAPAEPSTQ